MGSRREDIFFYKQPPLGFVDELFKPVHTKKPEWFGRTRLQEGEVLVSNCCIDNQFLDAEGLLETAIKDFEQFLEIYGLKASQAAGTYSIRLMKKATECFEAYRIIVGKDNCIIEADDTEGIRRGLIWLEDEMHRREGGILPFGRISRKPVIRERITRGFFSPTNRPPKCIDELMDDVDYYPEEYLNRLAHDGTNGLWIYTYFNQLLTSDCFPEYGTDSAKRLSKLKKIVARCKRYGIKVWVFGVEPYAMEPKLAQKYVDSVGIVGWNGHHSICTYSELGAEYCIEVTRRLMEEIPDLGGIIDITYGERPTTCGNSDDHSQCPRCREHSRSEVIAHSIDLLKEGIRRSGSKAEFVSWTYGHRRVPLEEIREYVQLAPQDVTLMENFEDAGYVEQLGKTRQAMDYWLSYVGPSQMYQAAAEEALKRQKTMFAKMQVCCSHELATVPYIPVPGILFDKYAGAYKYNVKGVMQCWYFGNYPSLMSKVAGELAFLEDFSDKTAFLKSMAGIYYGSKAEQAVAAWECFKNGYKNYPVNIMFSYYGPMHDGVVWDLALLPKDASLPRSWQLLDKPDGDRIGECLQTGHTLNEAVVLTDIMQKNWQLGMELLPAERASEQYDVANALSVLMASGCNILKFYELRDQLAESEDTDISLDILAQMEAIVDREIKNSKEMTALCEKDTRLGYHSEAEGYKFFPEKLQVRIENLKILKQKEFSFVRQRLHDKGKPLLWYQGDEENGYKLTWEAGEQEHTLFTKAIYEDVHGEGRFRMSYDEEYLYVELSGKPKNRYRLHFEYKLMWPSPGIVLENGEFSLTRWAFSHQSIWGEKAAQELAKYKLLVSEPEQGHYIMAVDRKKAGWTEDVPLRVMLAINDVSWIYDDDPVHYLGKNDISPGEFGWLMPEKRGMSVKE